MNTFKRHLVILAGTFGYIGRIPGPGGTIGSFCVYLFAAGLVYAGLTAVEFGIVFTMLLILSTVLSVFVGRNASAVFGQPDPNCVVVDEVAGVSVTLLFFPYLTVYRWQGLMAAFFLFRFFDIFKPCGIRSLEAVPHGWGIVLDDIAAGAAGLVLIQVSRFVLL